MKRAVMVAGLAFGDEGKGTMVDWLARHHGASLVVRGGGCQAAHNVVTDEGVHHTFAQFGSATLAGVPTFLSSHMLVEPMALEQEAAALAGKGIPDPLSMVTVHPSAVIVTPYHKWAGRIRERARGSNCHGTTGMGIGECRSDAERGLLLWVQDVLPHGFPGILQRIREDKLQEMEPMREAAPEEFARLEACSAAEIWEGYREILSKVRRSCWPGPKGTVVFEGSQGVLLDEYHGFAPYNTWVDTTFQWADGILNDDCGFSGKRERVGILRAYFTRHGPGPFPTEDASLAVPEEHNKANGWAGAFRVGRFDLELAQYAVERARPDCIALTHVDSPLFQPGMIEQIEKGIGVPVRYTSAGPCAKDKRVRKGE